MESYDNPSDSDFSSDEDEALIRLAENSRKHGKKESSTTDILKRQETQVEKNTAILKKANKKAQKVNQEKKKEEDRLKATINAIQAKTNSLGIHDHDQTQTSKEYPVITDASMIKNLDQLFVGATDEVKELFLEGQQSFEKKDWDTCIEKWSQADVKAQEIKTLFPEKPSPWIGEIQAHLGFVYEQKGYIQSSLSYYNQIMQRHVSNQYRKDLVIQVLNHMSNSYRDIGEMEKAKFCTAKGKKLLETMMKKNPVINASSSPTPTDFLHQAIEGDFHYLEDFVEKNLIVSSCYVDPKTHVTFLMVAAGHGKIQMMKQLLSCTDVQIDAKDLKGHTALAWGCKFNQLQSIQLLLNEGASFSNMSSSELKSWPLESLNVLKAHMAKQKTKIKTSSAPPLPPAAPAPPNENKNAWVKPLKKPKAGDEEDSAVVHKVDKSNYSSQLNKNFDAAPRSEAAIKGDLFGRELKRWVESTSVSTPENLNSMENDEGEWEQFETNERLFGVKSTYNEELYTTKLGVVTKEQEKEAERLANEIEVSSTSNTHIAEERGQVLESSNDDEEARYGAVLGSGAYGSKSNKTQSLDSFTDAEILKK